MTLYLRDPDVELHHGDALAVLRELPDESVDAVVTSPPYADARPDVPGEPLDTFAEWMEPILAELLRVTVRGGSLMLNLGRRFRDGCEHTFNEQTAARAEVVGWQRIDTIIWSKTNPAGKGSPYLTNAHEYVYWFGVTADAYRGYDETRQPYALESLARFKRAPRPPAKLDPTRRPGTPPHPNGAKPWSVFACSVGEDKGNPHPSPMATRLARHLVLLSCPPGGLVLDCFAGSGTTLYVARKLGRRSIGIDLSSDYLAMASRRLAQQSLLAEGIA